MKKKHNFVYLIREREFIRLDENVYKLGKTTQLPNSRLQGYPKSSQIVLFIDVFDCHTTEKKLISAFDSLFINRKDIGREYYEGELNAMKRTFFNIIDSEFLEPYKGPKEHYGWAWSTIYFIGRLFYN